MTQQHRPDPYSRKQAASYLGISEAFLKKLDLSGRGPAAIRIGRRWSYLQADLDAFLDQHRHDPAANDAEHQEVAA
ncbi:helix-turn-helix domain-containing protein [Lamprobacter modestohalophilus]|uniref:helix-turn-helix transcriptional regulator n=1 Tax=Lamprobacter modestohalophilus TaxID=1064514 RepID=UPI002ADEE132|nr:helix-turn-helix domain-containing protein [Lamprobacter modestohalophilus]MEA1050497.1 helix-turn-helix domain-containing protein [Lamprobacter modestohalophilus]